MVKRSKVSGELRKLGKKFNALLVVPAEKLQRTMDEALKFLIKNNTPGIYISLSKPYSSIINDLKKNKIDKKNILFIDCITETVSAPKRQKGISYVHSPADLTRLSIELGEFMESNSSNKFLMMGSLSTLLIYNNMNVVAAFVGNVAGKSSVCGIRNIIVTSPEKEMELIKKITPFFDKILRVE